MLNDKILIKYQHRYLRLRNVLPPPLSPAFCIGKVALLTIIENSEDCITFLKHFQNSENNVFDISLNTYFLYMYRQSLKLQFRGGRLIESERLFQKHSW